MRKELQVIKPSVEAAGCIWKISVQIPKAYGKYIGCFFRSSVFVVEQQKQKTRKITIYNHNTQNKRIVTY